MKSRPSDSRWTSSNHLTFDRVKQAHLCSHSTGDFTIHSLRLTVHDSRSMLQASYHPYLLSFKEPATTSREVMVQKKCWFVKVWEARQPAIFGVGECALFPGLSAEDRPEYENRLAQACREINEFQPETLQEWSSICFGIETALADLQNGGQRLLFPSPFTRGEKTIPINGLVWMGDRETMERRVEEKIITGFRCLKLKIGSLDFQQELALLRQIRTRFKRDALEIRVDANGAFRPEEALRKLEQLSSHDIHSIEQPIRQGQWQAMSRLCRNSPIPIALDEELIGITSKEQKRALLEEIAPRYIILKPTLVGGFYGCDEWISLIQKSPVAWWATSALESNIGLNAIAQWTATQENPIPQGLGTGQLFTNNIPSPLTQEGSTLGYNPKRPWNVGVLFSITD